MVYNYVNNYFGKNEVNVDNNITVENRTNEMFAIYNNYAYFLPENVFYDIKLIDGLNMLHFYENKTNWGAFINTINMKEKLDASIDEYDKIEEKIRAVENDVKNRKIIEEKNAVSFEVYGDKANYLLSYMPAYDDYEYQIIIYAGYDRYINYDALDTTLNILLTGKKCEY